MSETKYSTLFLSGTSIDSGIGYSVNINPVINSGTDKSQRIGNRIQYKFLQFRAVVRSNFVSGGNSGLVVRVIVWQSRLPYVATSVSSNDSFIFMNTGVASAVVSPLNNQNLRVLFDRLIPMGAANNAANVQLPAIRVFKLKIRVNNNVNFANSTSTLPTDPKDLYYFTVVTDQTTTTNTLNITSCTRISFTDA